jgi:hypothetical protein
MLRRPFAAFAALAFAWPALGQVQRAFPQNALRAEMAFGMPPEVKVNGQAARLAPGARIRNQNNLLEMSGALVGATLPVHYTLDDGGSVRDVWLLRSDELAREPWPTSLEQAQRWSFDPIAQTWSKR